MKKPGIIDVLRELSKENIRYAVAGGVAVVIYGYERLTKDLDLVIDLSIQNVKKFIKLMEKLKFKPRVPENPENLADKEKREIWIKEKGAKTFTFIHPYNPFISVDVLLEYEYRKIKKKRVRFRNIEIKVVSLEDLLKMKKKAGRLRDLDDIEKLKRLHDER